MGTQNSNSTAQAEVLGSFTSKAQVKERIESGKAARALVIKAKIEKALAEAKAIPVTVELHGQEESEVNEVAQHYHPAGPDGGGGWTVCVTTRQVGANEHVVVATFS